MNRTQLTIFAALVLGTLVLLLCSDERYLLTSRFSGRVGDGYAIVTQNAAWIPQKEQIAAAQREVRAFLESRLRSPDVSDYTKKEIQKILSRWPNYRFQVFGKIENGRRLIHLNFAIIEEKYWMRNELLQVADGGASFWQVDFDQEARTFTRLEINGYA